MGNVESVQKNSKISVFFYENWPKKHFWSKPSLQAGQMNGVPSIKAKNNGISKLLVETELKNMPSAL